MRKETKEYLEREMAAAAGTPEKAKRPGKAKVVEAIKSGQVKCNLGGVDSGSYKVSAPRQDVMQCACGRSHKITPKTVGIGCNCKQGGQMTFTWLKAKGIPDDQQTR